MKKNILTMILGIIFLFALIGRYEPVELSKAQNDTIEVEIKGGVVSPGTYFLTRGASIEQLINQAGGLSENADLSSISLLTELKHNDLIVIPLQDDQTQSLISLNGATSEQLQTLPGVGPSTADKIIAYRSENPFTSLEDLMNVKGIGEKTFEKLKDRICL